MSFPLDDRVVTLLSVFEDSSSLDGSRYSSRTRCHHQRYVRHAHAGDLTVTVWSHSGTTWATLEGLLDRRACRALAGVLMRVDAPEIVLNVAGLELPAPRGGTPLVGLCATLSYAGYSVSVVGQEPDEQAESGAVVMLLEPRPQPHLMMVTDESA